MAADADGEAFQIADGLLLVPLINSVEVWKAGGLIYSIAMPTSI
jgi:hypothetical protein